MTALVAVWMVLVVAWAWRWRPPPRRRAPAHPFRLDPSRSPRSAAPPPAAPSARVAGLVGLSVLLGAAWPPLAALPPLAVFGHRRWGPAPGGGGSPTRPCAVARPRCHRPLRRRRGRRAHADPRRPPSRQHWHRVPFAAAFAEVGRRVDRGQRVADALGALVEQLGEPARPLVIAIGGAERYGTPLAPTLELLGQEARRERRRHAEERARTLPVKLCFPLVGCSLPAFVLLTIAPLVAGAFRSLTV